MRRYAIKYEKETGILTVAPHITTLDIIINILSAAVILKLLWLLVDRIITVFGLI